MHRRAAGPRAVADLDEAFAVPSDTGAERTLSLTGGFMSLSHVTHVAARHRTALLVGSGLAVFLTFQAFVTPGSSVDAATVVPTGRLLASNCFQCHGTNGLNGGFDTIAGESDLFGELKELQSDSSIMGAHARGYTDAELTKIAAYLRTIPKP